MVFRQCAQRAQKGVGDMLLTVEALERETGVSRHTWRSWLRERKIPFVRLGRTVRVTEEDLRAFVAAGRVPARKEDATVRHS